MQRNNLIEKSFYKEKRGISLVETPRLVAEFFNGVVVEVEEEYVHES